MEYKGILSSIAKGQKQKIEILDAVIIGAGFSGLYQCYSLREIYGDNLVVLEAGDEIGGTWHWNRYPGARCDCESHSYCYYFSDVLLAEWEWSERYPKQTEILSYLNFVADKLDLRGLIRLGQRLSKAAWSVSDNCWHLQTKQGLKLSCRILVSAVGCLSSANIPSIAGLEDFEGACFHTGKWPLQGVNFSGKKVVVIGTGSTGIQVIPKIAEKAQKVSVLQRTANYSIPARNTNRDARFWEDFRKNQHEWHNKMIKSRNGHPWQAEPRKLKNTEPSEALAILDAAWQNGGLRFKDCFDDILTDLVSNKIMADFISSKIRDKISDPRVANILTDFDHAFATKRPPIDFNYFETFNLAHVDVVDIRSDPIKRINKGDVELKSGARLEADIIVFATGFDAITGALNKIDIIGKEGRVLSGYWQNGPKTYLGLAMPDFPNFFMITGPGSPSVLTNMPRAIEQHVEWITGILSHMKIKGFQYCAVKAGKPALWAKKVEEAAGETLMPTASHSWYLGANIKGKPRQFMPYAGGLNRYREICLFEANSGYQSFVFSP